jgi:hypothetical protein
MWPRGLRHEMSSPIRTLGSWFGIPLQAWMYVRVFLFVCRVYVAALRKADHPS